MVKRGDLRLVAIKSGELEYDSDMPIGALRALFGAMEGGDFGALIDALSQFVTKWPFEGSPKKPEDWNGLKRSQFTEIASGVMTDLQALGEE